MPYGVQSVRECIRTVVNVTSHQ